MPDLKDLGGIVQGEKRRYRVEVTLKQPKPGVVELDSVYDITVFDDETGKYFWGQKFRLRKGNTFEDLREFVEEKKRAAKRDFSSNA